ncbi:MAG: hypothetical protein J6V99_03005 [Neisseriaceae bacterium]|nr:hypothetical protein [Neisseriaceae bacterium]
MILIAIIFLLLGFIFCMWVVSRILGRIGYATHGEKGRKIGRKVPWMLLLAFMAYNIVEYFYVRFQVQYLCKKEAGVFVYVTPEQWKKQNKKQWETLVPYEYQHGHLLADKMKTINIDGTLYEVDGVLNEKIIRARKYNSIHRGVAWKKTILLFDQIRKTVLMKWNYVEVYRGRAIVNEGGFDNFLFRWAYTVQDCSRGGYRFYNLENEYSNQFLTK